MTVGAIRQAIQELAECPVCRRPPDLVDASTFPWNQDIEMVAKCYRPRKDLHHPSGSIARRPHHDRRR